MFSTCLFCRHSLGTNDVIEAFPIGRRLAFDPAKGRLWVVCRSCERWNLTPLEERWEAVEQAERLYRETRLRMATENVGLARLADATDLVRIGKPLRPELASWRYGDQFGRRRRRMLLRTGVGLAGIGAVVAGGTALGIPILGYGGWMVYEAARNVTTGDPGAIVAMMYRDGRPPREINRAALSHIRLAWEMDRRDWALEIPAPGGGTSTLRGDEARQLAARLLPAVNRYGGSPRAAKEAVALLERHGDPETLFRAMARGYTTAAGYRDAPDGSIELVRGAYGALAQLPHRTRLALEMAAHEDMERRALEGELAELERAWRDAEEIAAIADDLLLPAGVHRFLERHRPRG